MINELKNLDPQLIAIAEDKTIGLLGYVVVDRTFNNRACGGLRIAPDLTIEELKGLARSMTLKYGFSGMQQGGAKAGIVGDYNLPADKNRSLLRRFGAIITPLLKSRYYIPGTDINTTNSDIIDMLDKAGIAVPARRRKKGNKSGFFTALSVLTGTESAAVYKKMNLNNCTIAIEGFGSVGSSYAWLMAKKKQAKIVAISTINGAIYNKDGLDINKLFLLKEKYGDELVNQYKEAEKIDKTSLFDLKVDILSPCARHFSINHLNAATVQASIVCPGANIPVTSAAEKILFNRGIISIPDFISNCGGVVGSKLEITGVSDNFIENYLRRRNTSRIIKLIEKSYNTEVPMIKIAEEEAMRNFYLMQTKVKNQKIGNSLYNLATKVVNEGFVPEFILKKISTVYFNHTLRNEV